MTAKTATPTFRTGADVQKYPFSVLERIAKLESDRARLIEALEALTQWAECDEEAGRDSEVKQARSLLRELEGK